MGPPSNPQPLWNAVHWQTQFWGGFSLTWAQEHSEGMVSKQTKCTLRAWGRWRDCRGSKPPEAGKNAEGCQETGLSERRLRPALGFNKLEAGPEPGARALGLGKGALGPGVPSMKALTLWWEGQAQGQEAKSHSQPGCVLASSHFQGWGRGQAAIFLRLSPAMELVLK